MLITANTAAQAFQRGNVSVGDGLALSLSPLVRVFALTIIEPRSRGDSFARTRDVKYTYSASFDP